MLQTLYKGTKITNVRYELVEMGLRRLTLGYEVQNFEVIFVARANFPKWQGEIPVFCLLCLCITFVPDFMFEIIGF